MYIPSGVSTKKIYTPFIGCWISGSGFITLFFRFHWQKTIYYMEVGFDIIEKYFGDLTNEQQQQFEALGALYRSGMPK
jgi:hypothetical protein